MATTIETISAIAADHDQCVVMHGVDWNGYRAVLRARGGRSIPRLVYLDGDLYLTSFAFYHEHLSCRLGQFVIEVVVGLEIPCTPAGSTTFRHRKTRGGVEGDETFYLANASRIAGKNDLHLRNDPPPDLAIEVVPTRDADPAVEVWRRFGVPEVWVCDSDALHILARQPDGAYAEATESLAFPFLKAAEIFEWIARPLTGNETDWLKQLRAWVRDVLLPRYQARANDAGGA